MCRQNFELFYKFQVLTTVYVCMYVHSYCMYSIWLCLYICIPILKVLYIRTYIRTNANGLLFSNYFSTLVPVSRSVTFGEVTRGLINDSTTYSDSAHYRAPFGEVEDSGTSHVSVLDPSGLAVSVTR